MLKTEKLRQKFNKKFSYKDLGSKEIYRLYSILEKELSNFKNGQFHMKLNDIKIIFEKDGTLKESYFFVRGIVTDEDGQFEHFSSREAISFNSDGFIGFCGWVDSTNQKPFIDSFNKFIKEL